MARIFNPNAKQISGWEKWVASRPDAVRTIAERFDPWTIYRMKSTDQRVTLASIFEDGTVSVNVSPEHNPFTFVAINVFGIDPDDLDPCEEVA